MRPRRFLAGLVSLNDLSKGVANCGLGARVARQKTERMEWPRQCQRGLVLACVALVAWAASLRAEDGLTEALRREPMESLLQAAREDGDAGRGAVLFANRELGCAACHNEAGGARMAPDLRQLPDTRTEGHLLESLLYPSRTITDGYELTVLQTVDGRVLSLRVLREADGVLIGRGVTPPYERVQLALADIEERTVSPVSAMPDGLPDQLQSRQQFLDLLRYVLDLRDRGHEGLVTAAVPDETAVPEGIRGAVLFDRLGCRACHSDDRWQTVTAGSVSPDRAPLLEDVAARFRPDALIRYLADPHTAKPGTRMPDVLGDALPEDRRKIAAELAAYLLSRGDKPPARVACESEKADRGEALFHSVGCVACHSPRDADGRELLATTSVPLGQVGERMRLPALVAFLEDPTAIRPGGRMPNMQLSHREAEDLAHYLLEQSQQTEAAHEANRVVPEAELAQAGERQYRQLNCAACHEPETQPRVAVVPIDQPAEGCLSGQQGGWPTYSLTAEERQLLIGFCDHDNAIEPQPILSAMATLNCYACHQRDGIGGVDPQRDGFFTTADFNLGPQGRLPPSLSGVGEKLRPAWLRQVLVSGRSVRPYMHTRMPRFGLAQVEPLTHLLPPADDLPDRSYPPVADPKVPRDAGHELAGTKGLNCIACHTFQRQPAATMSAVDLTEMTERLQRDWFVAYLRNPQALSPGTVMPSFWPGGRGVRQEILEGDTERQLEALWVYLEQGRQARAPQGLVLEPLKLLATDEAVILRRSWPGVGKRGIGVGYPEEVNLVFDAEEMRLAMLWKGPFADPGGVWRSQGHGTVRPLGRDVVQLAQGPDVTDPAEPWEASESIPRPPGYRFGGYELDEEVRRPRLRYQADRVLVEEFFSGQPAQALERSVVLLGRQVESPRHFRLLSGATIEQQGNGAWRADSGLLLTLSTIDGMQLAVVDTKTGQELRVKLPAGDFEYTLNMVYAW